MRNRVILGRISIVFTLFPFYLASVKILTIPMVLTLGILLFTLNWPRIKSIVSNFISAHFWLKIQYFWFSTAIIVIIMLIRENGNTYVEPQYLIGLGFLLLNFIWFNKINNLMTQEHRRIILKGETTETSSSLDFEPYLVPLSYTLLILVVIAPLESMYLTGGANLFDSRTFYWYFILVLLIIHFIIDMVFVEQIEWYPKEGSTKWKEIPGADKILAKLPDLKNYKELEEYFSLSSKIDTPPEGLDRYIEDNLQFLVKNAQNITYFPFQINYIRSIENWGKQGRSHLHLAFAIILASVSQYRFIGLIPLYRRKLFYQTLQAIAMTGSMTTRWRDLIQFEVIGKKDEHFVLDWVLGSRFLQAKYNPDWIITWEGRIYKGKTGYYEAVQKMDKLIHIRPEMNPWQLDVWDLCFEYAQVFVGENSRQLLSENIQYYDKLLYLSGKRTSKEYEQSKEAYKQKLLNPENRLVVVPEAREKKILTPDDKKDIINTYLGTDEREFQDITFLETITNLKIQLIEYIQTIRVSALFWIIGLITIYLVNLGLILLLDRTLENNLGLFLIMIETALLFIFSISPSDGEFNHHDELQIQAAVLQTSTFNPASMQSNSGNFNTNTVLLLYGISLLFVYQYFFT